MVLGTRALRVTAVGRLALPGLIEKAEAIREEEQNVVGWSRSAEFSVEKLLQVRRVRH